MTRITTTASGLQKNTTGLRIVEATGELAPDPVLSLAVDDYVLMNVACWALPFIPMSTMNPGCMSILHEPIRLSTS
ncbi:MAG: hypothetical protein R3B47_19410 [Bacteroidia bacterium]